MTEQMTNIYNSFIAANEGNNSNSGIRKSFETFDKTGSHQYLHEIYDGDYVVVDKARFSQNLMYIPGRFVIAYNDISEIEHLNGINEYEIRMVDGQKYHLCMLKVTSTELSKHISSELTRQMNNYLGFKDTIFLILCLGILYAIGYGITSAVRWVISLFS